MFLEDFLVVSFFVLYDHDHTQYLLSFKGFILIVCSNFILNKHKMSDKMSAQLTYF